MNLYASLRTVTFAIVSALFLQMAVLPARAQDSVSEGRFTYLIPFELGTFGFAAGDNITITTLKGDRAHLEPDGAYLVQGTYTLASVDKATLMFSCTSRGPSGSTPVSAGQKLEITRGTGTFSLTHTSSADGWLHVSFYAAHEGHSHGGIYFGEQGVENTILRKTDWPDFSAAAASTEQSSAPAQRAAQSPVLASSGDPNRAIVAFLGDPVPAPANLDEKYTPTNLTSAFMAVSAKAGWHVQSLAVDDSEFPFLVYGLLAGWHEINASDIRQVQGYDYGGAVRGSTSGGSTYFALSMIPHNQYPAGQTDACHRRLMIRLQMLAAAAGKSE